MADPLKRLAERLAEEPRFLAGLLAELADVEGLDDAELSRRLGCPVERLTELRLCRSPRPEPAFAADVRTIAARLQLDETRLLEILRLAAAVQHLRQGTASPAGLLLAARQRDEKKEPPP